MSVLPINDVPNEQSNRHAAATTGLPSPANTAAIADPPAAAIYPPNPLY
ncbi:MAG: hypothetical protein SFX18_14275 [Pirellulales bacterium]|nr:hypothetical protein [Pirellulales bacterium]